MSIDGITLFGIRKELSDLIIGGKINRVFQIKKYKIVLEIKLCPTKSSPPDQLLVDKKIIYLHLSLEPGQMEIYFSTVKNSFQILSTPFSTLLQNKLEGGKILDIIQIDFDRILSLIIQNQTKFSHPEKLTLTAEFMEKHSNLILINQENLVEGSLKIITSRVNRYREVVVGKTYLLPPSQNKLNPLKLTKDEFLSLFNSAQGQKVNLLQLLRNNIQGINTINLQEIIYQAHISTEKNIIPITPKNLELLWFSWQNVIKKIKTYNFKPIIYFHPSSKKMQGYILIGNQQFGNYKTLPFSNINSCLKYFFQEKEKEKELILLKGKIEKIFSKNLFKLENKISLLQQNLKMAKNYEQFRLMGELLKSNLQNIKKGISEVTVLNFYSPQQEMITIPLKSQLSPLQNAQYYFKKYRKAKNSLRVIFENLNKTQEKLTQLKQFKEIYAQNNGLYDQLINLYQQLIKNGWEKKQIVSLSNKKKKSNNLQPIRYISKDGWEIYVGKNSRQNDYLTTKLASGNDIWLHIKDYPGSHVVIKNKGQKQIPPLPVLLQAAKLAAYYSKIKNETTVNVIYTFKKYIKKPKNSKAGMVIYSQEKNLLVKINPQEIKSFISNGL